GADPGRGRGGRTQLRRGDRRRPARARGADPEVGGARAAEVRVIDLLIRGGHVVTPFEEGELEIGIEGEQIAFVAPPRTMEVEAGRTLDATGRLVFPGGVEAHAHIHEPMHRGWTHGEEVWLQPPEGATRAALFGGTTTVVSF